MAWDWNPNTGPHYSRPGGVVKFARRKYQHERLIPFVGEKVFVTADDLWDGGSVDVSTILWFYRQKQPRPVADKLICTIKQPLEA